jgi:hypothetical protein
MKIFFYMGRNPANKSGVSWKIWKIERDRRKVTMFWGAATLRNRKVTPTGTLKSKIRHFSSEDAAREFEAGRIRSKLRKGYERRTRSRSL